MKPTFPRIGLRNLRGLVVESIRKTILSGDLHPDQPLVQSNIAEQMGVSKGPVREALSQLEEEGLVYSIPNKGTFVARFTFQDADELFTLRDVLESGLVDRVLEEIDDEDIAYLEKLLRERARVLEEHKIAEAVKLDMNFHRYLFELAKHKLLLHIWSSVAFKIEWLMTLLNQVLETDYGGLYQPESSHDQIMEALRRRDAEDTRKALSDHINASRKMILDNWPFED